MKNKKTITKMVTLAILTALIVVLQMIAQFMKIGEFQISLVLVPIAIGAIMYGPLAGTYLGLVFGGIVLLNGDAAGFLAINAFGTVVTVLGKGALAGCASGWVFKALKRKSRIWGVILASIVAPIVNTGLFALAAFTIFHNTMVAWAGEGASVFAFVMVTMIGVNFFVEFGITTVLSPTIVRIVEIANQQLNLGIFDSNSYNKESEEDIINNTSSNIYNFDDDDKMVK